jgi:hypothetical protein
MSVFEFHGYVSYGETISALCIVSTLSNAPLSWGTTLLGRLLTVTCISKNKRLKKWT